MQNQSFSSKAQVTSLLLIFIAVLFTSTCQKKTHTSSQANQQVHQQVSQQAIITHTDIDPRQVYPIEDVKASGLKLMDLSNGLHLFPSPLKKKENELILLVHGYGSHGYEWIHALHQSHQHADVGFYKWDHQLCHHQAALDLSKMLETLNGQYQKIKIYAHSYGGIITSLAAVQQKALALDLNIIASPLAGHPKLKDRCGFEGVQGKVPEGQNWTQWQTLVHLDNAFKDLAVNPQIVSIEGMKVVLLPDEYQGQRLGHNWSISYVIDQMKSFE
jgi:hypothetical protein